jgi:acyl-CoA thioester hydrolase
MPTFTLPQFPSRTVDKIRYADTDCQGHVNNAVFATFLETGRVEILYHPQDPILPENASFVIASLVLWQQLFQHDICVTRAETVIVQVDHLLKRSLPLSQHAQQRLSQWLILP